MLTTTKIVRYILMASVVFLLLGLLWWYFFLRSQSQTITSSDSARGYDTGAASFQNAIGSTYNNIVSGISSFINDSDTWGTGKGSAPKQLWHVTKTPVAGMSFVGSGATLRLRFVERSTGQILEADPADGTVVRLTDKLGETCRQAARAEHACHRAYPRNTRIIVCNRKSAGRSGHHSLVVGRIEKEKPVLIVAYRLEARCSCRWTHFLNSESGR